MNGNKWQHVPNTTDDLSRLQFERCAFRYASTNNYLRWAQSKYGCSNRHGRAGAYNWNPRSRKQPLSSNTTECLYRKSDLYNKRNFTASDPRVYYYLPALLQKQHHFERCEFRYLGELLLYKNTPSRLVCNSSCAFISDPPIVMCKDDSLNIDFSVQELDGDSVFYSLCQPLHGGSQNNPAPNPPSSPPYTPVPFTHKKKARINYQ